MDHYYTTKYQMTKFSLFLGICGKNQLLNYLLIFSEWNITTL